MSLAETLLARVKETPQNAPAEWADAKFVGGHAETFRRAEGLQHLRVYIAGKVFTQAITQLTELNTSTWDPSTMPEWRQVLEAVNGPRRQTFRTGDQRDLGLSHQTRPFVAWKILRNARGLGGHPTGLQDRLDEESLGEEAHRGIEC